MHGQIQGNQWGMALPKVSETMIFHCPLQMMESFNIIGIYGVPKKVGTYLLIFLAPPRAPFGPPDVIFPSKIFH